MRHLLKVTDRTNLQPPRPPSLYIVNMAAAKRSVHDLFPRQSRSFYHDDQMMMLNVMTSQTYDNHQPPAMHKIK